MFFFMKIDSFSTSNFYKEILPSFFLGWIDENEKTPTALFFQFNIYTLKILFQYIRIFAARAHTERTRVTFFWWVEIFRRYFLILFLSDSTSTLDSNSNSNAQSLYFHIEETKILYFICMYFFVILCVFVLVGSPPM